MEAEEITTRIAEAKRACAEADCVGPDENSAAEKLAKMAAALRRLLEATEWLAAEREAFAGRLRRTSTVKPSDAPPRPAPGGSIEASPPTTPSPGSDA